MAIDDNTLYGLTGAQVKELPERIEAVKGLARELTTEDYNWPTANPDGVAMWLMPVGFYQAQAGTKVYWTNNTSGTNRNTFLRVDAVDKNNFGNGKGLIVFRSRITGYDEIFNTPIWIPYIADDGRSDYSSSTSLGQRFMTTSYVIDNLTSRNPYYALSANQGRVLKGLVDSIAIRGAGAPTTSTVGQVGTLYEDTTNGDLYICTDATNPYVWEEVGAGGGTGPTVVQTTGTSQADVMSQNAVTQTLFDGTGVLPTNHIAIGSYAATQGGRAANASVSIGGGARANGEFGISIGGYGANNAYATAAGNSIAIGGYNPNASGVGSIAIGSYGAAASGKGSIALGYASSATVQGQMDIGSTSTGYGYNNSAYRLLTGLYDPQSAHDAATKGYVDTAVAGAGASVFTTNEWNALWA